MTVAELIEELKKQQPHHPVKLRVAGGGGQCAAEDCGFSMCDSEGELRDVLFQGNHIRLEGD